MLRIGIVYDLLGSGPRGAGDPPDADAEYEPEETIALLESALASLGHETLRLGNPHALLARLGKGEPLPVDAALNVAEVFGSRNREAWAPVLLEMAGVPCVGSDALCLSATLDKWVARTLAAAAGIRVAPGCVMASAAEARSIEIPGGFPLFVKPRWEGTAKGIGPASRALDEDALERAVERVLEVYGQPALVEAFLPGAEYTVTVVGHDPPRALPVLQRALEAETGIGVHALERHPAPPGGWRTTTPGSLTPELERELCSLALRAFDALDCRDFARVDFRLDAQDRPVFLEANPLPTFARDGSFGILAELEGHPLEALLAGIFREGLARLGLGLA